VKRRHLLVGWPGRRGGRARDRCSRRIGRDRDGCCVGEAGLQQFAKAQPATIPPLASAVSTITPALPVATIPFVPASVTRIGPQAFTETLTANNAALAKSPFSSASDSFEIEVVG
jgi:hypothetical protein